MKLTREDIQKYATEDEKKVLTEKRLTPNEIEDLVFQYKENEWRIDMLEYEELERMKDPIKREEIQREIEDLYRQNRELEIQIGPRRLKRILGR